MDKKRKKSGFGLVEVLISVLLVVMIGTASLSLQFNSFRLADRAAQQTQAYYVAQEALETLKVNNYKYGNINYPFPSGESEDFDLLDGNHHSSTLYGNFHVYRIIKIKNAFGSDKYAKITVGVCFGPAAVNIDKCLVAKDARKDYVETMAVIKRSQP